MSLEREVRNLVIKANTELRKDVLLLLEEAYRKERNRKAKRALEIIIENAKLAKKEKLAICQDTGLPLVFLEVGYGVKIDKEIVNKINRGITRGYKEGMFRASTIDLENKISYSPDIVHIEFTKRKGLKIAVLPKGFGSENKSKLKMFRPTVSREEIDEFIVQTVKEAGCQACPPYILGVGIGGTADYCLFLAKKALLERLDRPHSDKRLEKWAKDLYNKINKLGIGPMGLGGRHTCLGVRIKTYPSHLAGLPIGVNISCHALRSAETVINNE